MMSKCEYSTTAVHLPVGHQNLPLTMSSREIAELCETRHNQVIETIERLFEKGVLRESRKTTRTFTPQGGGRPTEVYDLTKADTLKVVSGYDEVLRGRIIDRWMELEEAVKPSIPDFTNPVAAARAWADAQEARLIAERTKAQIGSHREASAMGKASAAVREANRLRRELGQVYSEASVKRVEGVTGKSFEWRRLKSYSVENSLPLRKVPDVNYPQGVNVYQAEAWMAVYGIDLSELFPTAH